MTNINDGNGETKVIATFRFSADTMLDALRSFLQVLSDAGVDHNNEETKFTVLGYLVEALAITAATTTEVSEGEDIAHIVGNHTVKRTIERLHEKWLCDLKTEKAERRRNPIDLTEIDPQGEA